MRGPSKNCPMCQCIFGSSNCVHWNTATETFEPILDDATDNLLECGPAGLAAFAPTWLLDPPACNIYCTFEQPIPFDTAQNLIFNEARYDTDSMYDFDAAPDRITFKTEGVYEVTLNIRWRKTDTDDTGDQAAFIQRNGSTYIALDSMSIGGPDLFGSQSVSYQGLFEVGDWVTGLVKQDGILDDKEINLPITVRRNSPVFAASFLRPAP